MDSVAEDEFGLRRIVDATATLGSAAAAEAAARLAARSLAAARAAAGWFLAFLSVVLMLELGPALG